MLVSIFFSYIATTAFAVLFNAPKRTLIPVGLIGAVGWSVYLLMRDYFSYSSPLSIFCGTVVLSDGILPVSTNSRLLFLPYPSIVPLVPGLPYLPRYVLYDNECLFYRHRKRKASMEAGAISLGISCLFLGFFNFFKVRRDRRFVYNRIKKTIMATIAA